MTRTRLARAWGCGDAGRGAVTSGLSSAKIELSSKLIASLNFSNEVVAGTSCDVVPTMSFKPCGTLAVVSGKKPVETER